MAKKEVKPLSKKASVLKYLEGHKKGITKEIAAEKFGVGNLGSIVASLRKDGAAIVCEKVTPKKGDPYTVYRLDVE